MHLTALLPRSFSSDKILMGDCLLLPLLLKSLCTTYPFDYLCNIQNKKKNPSTEKFKRKREVNELFA